MDSGIINTGDARTGAPLGWVVLHMHGHRSHQLRPAHGQ